MKKIITIFLLLFSITGCANNVNLKNDVFSYKYGEFVSIDPSTYMNAPETEYKKMTLRTNIDDIYKYMISKNNACNVSQEPVPKGEYEFIISYNNREYEFNVFVKE